MSCIHYKFRNNAKHDTIQFDGAYISVGEIKQTILGQKKMGKAPDFMLQIINAQTQEVYNDDNQLIPRNAEVTVKRIPTGTKVTKSLLAAQSQSLDMYKMSSTPLPLSVSMDNDLSKTEGTEEDKLKAIMMQQAMAYDNPNVNKRRGPEEELPLNYVCHRCNQPGHLIKNCPTNGNFVYDSRAPRPARKMTLSLKKREAPGSDMTAEEKRQMELNQKSTQDKVRSLEQEALTNIPSEMKCPICQQLMVDACLSTCCSQSFCDECIRERLLDEAICPACGDEVTPGQLISNKALRVTINKYKKDHQDRVAKLYSECHIKSSSRGSTPKPEGEKLPNSNTSKVESTEKESKPLVDATSSLTIKDSKPTSEADSTSEIKTEPLVSKPTTAVSAPTSIVTPSLPLLIPTSSFSTATSLPFVGMPPVSLGIPSSGIMPGSMMVPPVPMLNTVEPPPVAILPLENDTKSDTKLDIKKKAGVTSTILPLPSFPPPPPILPGLQSMPLLPFNPLVSAPPAGSLGLLPPPLPLPEPVSDSPNDRILDSSEFYAIQKELRRLQDKRRSRSSSRSRSPSLSSHSPPSRNSRGSSPPLRHYHRDKYGRRPDTFHRMRGGGPRVERRVPDFRFRGRGGVRTTGRLERNVKNDRARVMNHDHRDSDERRSREQREDEMDRPMRDNKLPRDQSNHADPDSRDKSRKKKEHKRGKHKKKDRKDKKSRKDKTDDSKPSLTEYSASDDSSDDGSDRKCPKSREISPTTKQIMSPRKASPSPDRTSPFPQDRNSPPPISPAQQSSDHRPSPPVLTPVSASPHASQSPISRPESPEGGLVIASPSTIRTGTPTAKGGVTPQFEGKDDYTPPRTSNGVSSEDDAVSIGVNGSEVNGDASSTDTDNSEQSQTEEYLSNLKRKEKLKELKAEYEAEKKKRKKKKKKKAKEEEKKKKRKHKKKKSRDDGEISSKKRKRSSSLDESQDSLEVVKKKSKKSKSSKKNRDESPAPTKSKGVEIKVNFTPLKDSNTRAKTISISSPPKSESRRVHLGVPDTKALKIKSKITDNGTDETKSKKTKSHKKSRHRISKSAVSGIEDDA